MTQTTIPGASETTEAETSGSRQSGNRLVWLVVGYGVLIILHVWKLPLWVIPLELPWTIAEILPFVWLLSIRDQRRSALVLSLGLLVGRLLSFLALIRFVNDSAPLQPIMIVVSGLKVACCIGFVGATWSNLGFSSISEAMTERGRAFAVAIFLSMVIDVGTFIAILLFALANLPIVRFLERS